MKHTLSGTAKTRLLINLDSSQHSNLWLSTLSGEFLFFSKPLDSSIPEYGANRLVQTLFSPMGDVLMRHHLYQRQAPLRVAQHSTRVVSGNYNVLARLWFIRDINTLKRSHHLEGTVRRIEAFPSALGSYPFQSSFSKCKRCSTAGVRCSFISY